MNSVIPKKLAFSEFWDVRCEQTSSNFKSGVSIKLSACSLEASNDSTSILKLSSPAEASLRNASRSADSRSSAATKSASIFRQRSGSIIDESPKENLPPILYSENSV
jgi:hypothetical protein